MCVEARARAKREALPLSPVSPLRRRLLLLVLLLLAAALQHGFVPGQPRLGSLLPGAAEMVRPSHPAAVVLPLSLREGMAHHVVAGIHWQHRSLRRLRQHARHPETVSPIAVWPRLRRPAPGPAGPRLRRPPAHLHFTCADEGTRCRFLEGSLRDVIQGRDTAVGPGGVTFQVHGLFFKFPVPRFFFAAAYTVLGTRKP